MNLFCAPHRVKSHISECANDAEQHESDKDVHGYKSSKFINRLFYALMDVKGDDGNACKCHDCTKYQYGRTLTPACRKLAKKTEISNDRDP